MSTLINDTNKPQKAVEDIHNFVNAILEGKIVISEKRDLENGYHTLNSAYEFIQQRIEFAFSDDLSIKEYSSNPDNLEALECIRQLTPFANILNADDTLNEYALISISNCTKRLIDYGK